MSSTVNDVRRAPGRHEVRGSESLNATIFNIQKFSVNDGPGIRTTVFFKGCPLACAWCHNPESIHPHPELVCFDKKCMGCHLCLNVCKQSALLADGHKIKIDRSKCIRCGTCTEVCPTEALQMAGKLMTLDEIMKEIEKDFVFYQQSGGGVTFSGGEPMVQIDALEALLKLSKARGLHTAVDTSGHAMWQDFERILDYTDLFLFDIKHLEEETHKHYTGVSNKIIIENLRQLSERKAAIGLRVPVIPGVNDGDAHIDALGMLLSSLHIQRIFLLPYHGIARSKYERLGQSYSLEGMAEPTPLDMENIKKRLEKYGLMVSIGG